MPCSRKAFTTSAVMSRRKGVFMTLKSVVALSNMVKPAWCLVVKTTYFMPAILASAAQSCGWNLRGLKVLGRSSTKRFRYASSAATIEWLITPPSWPSTLQWMNMPKPRSRNHSRRSARLSGV